ncbi:hypothetical protein Rsub_06765 [Raphidocelis subcapitata]|uniref:DM10 domain-containing protein n=1 Tax=Raphidocelis subcapitata TaxID=307507 RepID=A0A2V0P427_9CHLO|nr:hypothetical protein Rsub_06765 [Raphidocelis subcapitata]|eukprot:GBF93662.1 hypothetical protein Rsub_06765 [Raphidocelis subcapitata]
MWQTPVRLPLLPGNTLHWPEEGARPRRQLCSFLDGVPVLLDAPPPQQQQLRPSTAPPSAGHAGGAGGWPPASPPPQQAQQQPQLTQPQLTQPQLTQPQLTQQQQPQQAQHHHAVPAWIAFDGRVLRYSAWFREELPGSLTEPWRVRRCRIHFYLEDGSLEVVEPREENSGLPAGRFLRRHRVPRAGGGAGPGGGGPAGGFLDWRDLPVGGAVPLYGRQLRIAGCDAATRRWLAEQGAAAGPDEGVPEGPYDAAKREERALRDQHPRRAGAAAAAGAGLPAAPPEAARPRTAPPAADAGGGPGVLRFYGAFNTALHASQNVTAADVLAGGAARNSALAPLAGGAGGELLPLVVRHYLEDGTFEVAEVLPKKGGKDPFPRMLQRGRLPRALPAAGCRPAAAHERVAASRRAAASGEHYGADDLRIGAVINVYNRPVLLTGMDDYTARWYCARHGVPREALAPIEASHHSSVDFERAARRPPDVVPPNCELPIGDEADARANAARLLPRPPHRAPFTSLPHRPTLAAPPHTFITIRAAPQVPRPVPRDYAKWSANDGLALRFEARLLPPHLTHFDAERRFVVTFHPADDSLSVFEPPRRNSGLPGGGFAERARARRPGGGPLDYYGPGDMQIGGVLRVSGRHFELTDADEATLGLMERAPSAFPASDGAAAARALASELGARPEAAARAARALAALAGAGGGAGGDGRGGGAGAAAGPPRVTARELHAILSGCGLAAAARPGGLHRSVALVRALAGGGGGGGGGGSGGGGARAPPGRPAAEVSAPVADAARALGLEAGFASAPADLM